MVYKPLLPVFQLAQDYRAREIKSPKGRSFGRNDVQRLRDTWGRRRGSPRQCPQATSGAGCSVR